MGSPWGFAGRAAACRGSVSGLCRRPGLEAESPRRVREKMPDEVMGKPQVFPGLRHTLFRCWRNQVNIAHFGPEARGCEGGMNEGGDPGR